jgi:hypothetical protein
MIVRKNHPEGDFYETPAEVTNELLKREKFDKDGLIWEPACGNGAIVKVLEEYGFDNIDAFDIAEREFDCIETDFLKINMAFGGGIDWHIPDYIITNPPFTLALPFVKQSLKFAKKKVAMLLRMQFYETSGRYEFLKENPPVRIYSISDRPVMLGEDGKPVMKSGMMWFGWFVWEIGYKGHTTIIPIKSKEA